MGLTINYTLSAPESWASEEVRGRFEIIADYARHLRCDEVGDLESAVMRPDVTEKWFEKSTKLQRKSAYAEGGWLLTVQTGAGCEPTILGLCRYPGSRPGWNGHRWVEVASGFPHGWTFSWFCKTQFAGRHGTAHFVRCHKTVVSLLDFCVKAGLGVNVRDEAGYWEKRNEADLAKTVKQNEALLAAFGGMLKDMTGRKSK